MFTVVAYKLIKFAGPLRLQLAMVKWRNQTSKTQPYLVLNGNLVKTSHGRNVGLCELQSNLKSCQHSERGERGRYTERVVVKSPGVDDFYLCILLR